MAEQPLLNFPCDFAIKIFGVACDEFEINVLGIIRRHFPDLKENAIQTRHSKDKKYLAFTITIHANNREQIDNVYRELTASPYVLMAL